MPIYNILNFVIFQWFFFRLVKCYEKIYSEDEETGERVQMAQQFMGYVIFWGPIPLTGWWNEFKYVRNTYGYTKLFKTRGQLKW